MIGFSYSVQASPFQSYECQQRAEALVELSSRFVCWKGIESVSAEVNHLSPSVEFINECVRPEFKFSQISFGTLALNRVETDWSAQKIVFGVQSAHGGWPRGEVNFYSKGGLDCSLCHTNSYIKGIFGDLSAELFVESSGKGTFIVNQREIEMDGCVTF